MPRKKTPTKVTKKSPVQTGKKVRASKKSPAKKVTQKTTKTTVKKAAAKKTATKKSTPKKVTKKATKKKVKTKFLVCAADGHCFWTSDGQVLKDLNDLKLALGSMEETVFMYHANEDKNDFADWVEHVLQDPACADALRACATPKKAKTVVTTHLKFYSS